MLRILIVGAFGTIGKYVTKELQPDTEIITASFSQGDIRVDLNSIDSINTMYESLNGDLDAVICVASRGVVLKHLTDWTSLRLQFFHCQHLFHRFLKTNLKSLGYRP